jgi:hypothetical protein
VALVRTDVSEECIASIIRLKNFKKNVARTEISEEDIAYIIRVKRISELGTTLTATSNSVISANVVRNSLELSP